MEPPIGIEPMTCGLQDRRSTSWAMVALDFTFLSHLSADYIEIKIISNKNPSLCFFIFSFEQRMVPMGGVEPPTTGLWVLCSTAELHWHVSYESCSA